METDQGTRTFNSKSAPFGGDFDHDELSTQQKTEKVRSLKMDNENKTAPSDPNERNDGNRLPHLPEHIQRALNLNKGSCKDKLLACLVGSVVVSGFTHWTLSEFNGGSHAEQRQNGVERTQEMPMSQEEEEKKEQVPVELRAQTRRLAQAPNELIKQKFATLVKGIDDLLKKRKSRVQEGTATKDLQDFVDQLKPLQDCKKKFERNWPRISNELANVSKYREELQRQRKIGKVSPGSYRAQLDALQEKEKWPNSQRERLMMDIESCLLHIRNFEI